MEGKLLISESHVRIRLIRVLQRRYCKMIMERNMQPVIVLSFSKRDCEAYALQMSKLDFNTGSE